MNHFLALDSESTALPHEGGSIIELCILEVKDWVIVNRFYSMINPEREMTAGAFNAHKIDPVEYNYAPKFHEIEPKVSETLCKGLTIIGYNIIRCDVELLRNDYTKIGKEMPEELDILDVWKLANKLISKTEAERKTGDSSRSQQNVAKYFGIDTRGAHRAEADTLVLIQVYRKILETQEALGLTTDNKPVKVIKKEKKVKANTTIDLQKVLSNDSSDVHDDKITYAIPDKKENDNYEKTMLSETITKSAQKMKMFAGLIGVKPELVVAASIIAAKKLSVHLERIKNAEDAPVNSKLESDHAAGEITWLNNKKREVIEARQLAIAPIKKLVKNLETMFRELLSIPIDAAVSALTARRSSYLLKQIEQKKEDKKQSENTIEETAVFIAELAFEEAKKTLPIEEASALSEKVYEETLADLNKTKYSEKAPPVKIYTESGTVKDKVIYGIDVINASQVPKKWLRPDEDAILEYVNQTLGTEKIPGVMIYEEMQSKFRKH